MAKVSQWIEPPPQDISSRIIDVYFYHRWGSGGYSASTRQASTGVFLFDELIPQDGSLQPGETRIQLTTDSAAPTAQSAHEIKLQTAADSTDQPDGN